MNNCVVGNRMFRHQDHFVTKLISRFVTKNRLIRHQESVDSSPSRKVLQTSLNVDRNCGIAISRQAVIVTRLKLIGFSMLSVIKCHQNMRSMKAFSSGHDAMLKHVTRQENTAITKQHVDYL